LRALALAAVGGHASAHPPNRPSIPPPTCPPIRPPIHPFLRHSSIVVHAHTLPWRWWRRARPRICPAARASNHPSIHPSVHPSVRAATHPFIRPHRPPPTRPACLSPCPHPSSDAPPPARCLRGGESRDPGAHDHPPTDPPVLKALLLASVDLSRPLGPPSPLFSHETDTIQPAARALSLASLFVIRSLVTYLPFPCGPAAAVPAASGGRPGGPLLPLPRFRPRGAAERRRPRAASCPARPGGGRPGGGAGPVPAGAGRAGPGLGRAGGPARRPARRQVVWRGAT
jgi:hypothetical protein